MDNKKLREALAELQSQRNLLEAAISNIHNVLAMLNGANKTDASIVAEEMRRSYIEDVVMILEHVGKPLHVKAIVESVSQQRGTPISRASLESSIIRHITKLNGRARLAKFAPSTFGLSVWKETPILAQIAS